MAEGGRAIPAQGKAASRLQLQGSGREINEHFHEQGWTDGLPIIPPTEELVLEMLEACPLSGSHILGRIPPRDSSVTVEKVAINAVMAGCKPDYMPVVLAAVGAVLQPQFNVGSVSTTTGGAAPAIIVSGPVASRLGLHGGTAVLGSGHRANATIGRALRLVMRNLGGTTADTMEKSTQAWPGKYTMCLAENSERSPWKPFHVGLGFPPEASTVTVTAVRGVHLIWEGPRGEGPGVLPDIVRAIKNEGIEGSYYESKDASPVIVLCPEHAAEIASSGFELGEVREYLFRHIRRPLGELRGGGYLGGRPGMELFAGERDDYPVPLVSSPDNYLVVVAGGDGRNSSWMPAWHVAQRATEVIQE